MGAFFQLAQKFVWAAALPLMVEQICSIYVHDHSFSFQHIQASCSFSPQTTCSAQSTICTRIHAIILYFTQSTWQSTTFDNIHFQKTCWHSQRTPINFSSDMSQLDRLSRYSLDVLFSFMTEIIQFIRQMFQQANLWIGTCIKFLMNYLSICPIFIQEECSSPTFLTWFNIFCLEIPHSTAWLK